MPIKDEICDYNVEGIKERIARLFEEIQNCTCKQQQVAKQEEMERLENGNW